MFLKKKFPQQISREVEPPKQVQTISKQTRQQLSDDDIENDEEEITFKTAVLLTENNCKQGSLYLIGNQKGQKESEFQKISQQIYSSDEEQEIVFQSTVKKIQNTQIHDKRADLTNIQKQSLEKTNTFNFSKGKLLINPLYLQKINHKAEDEQFDISKFVFDENEPVNELNQFQVPVIMKENPIKRSNLQLPLEHITELNEQSQNQSSVSKNQEIQQTSDRITKSSQLNDNFNMNGTEQMVVNVPAANIKHLHLPYQKPLKNLLIADMFDFLNTPAPKGGMIQCTIIRDKSGLNRFSPTYKLIISAEYMILMTAKKSIIRMVSQNQKVLGKLKYQEGIFALFDNGESSDSNSNKSQIRQEIGNVIYDITIDTTKKPTELKVLLPQLNDEGNYKERFKAVQNKFVITDSYKYQSGGNLDLYLNRKPKWDDRSGGFVLNFFSRVKIASVKNFQLINPNDINETIYLQFGKVDQKRYNLDFLHPLTPLQAFMIALTSFQFKRRK